MPYHEAERLVLNAMATDPTRREGVRAIQHKIARQDNLHLTRYVSDTLRKVSNLDRLPSDFVSHIMHIHDPKGFDLREPTSKHLRRPAQQPTGVQL
jgi:hypothetical protein